MKLSGFRVGKPKPSMSDFDYLALDTAGRERRGSVKAASMDDARAVLGARKLYVVRMEPGSGASAPPLLSRRALFRKKLSAKQLTLFTRSEESRVGKECFRPVSTRWWPYHSKKKKKKDTN